MPKKTRYLVLAFTAGNIVLAGETHDAQDPVEAVVRRAVKHAIPPSDLDATPGDALEAPQCLIHLLPMTLMRDRRGRPFWSCHQKQADGAWCSYKPGAPVPATSSLEARPRRPWN